MRLKEISAIDVLPVRRFEIDNLSDVIVIAGQNGVGKSRLVDGLLSRFQSVGPPNRIPKTSPVRLSVEATCDLERTAWGQSVLDTDLPSDLQKLTTTLHANKSRTKWRSSVIHFESDRSIAQVQSFPPTWDTEDPWREDLGWNTTFGGLKARFQDTLHSLFRKAQNHESQIARRAMEMQSAGAASMDLDFQDPLVPFKEAFAQLLAPKILLDLNPRDQQLYYEHQGQRLPVSSMSSGEREVVNIVFDFILRAPSDCIIFFDEPELHLHPELSFRLLQTLKSVGNQNQFIFCTHSPDIITASLENTVVFISPPRIDTDGRFANQAIVVAEDDSTNSALRLLGQSVGIVALGKKIVLIEGAFSSLDKQTYGSILKDRFPSLVLVPSGGRNLVESFHQVSEKILSQTVWGVDFFMLCDRDATDKADVASEEQLASGRLKYLKRYHLENYFLDGAALAKVFDDMEPEESWLRNEAAIEAKLREFAIKAIPYAVALIVSAQVRRDVGNVSIMAKGVDGCDASALASLVLDCVKNESLRTHASMDPKKIEALVRSTFEKLEAACTETAWKTVIPGKRILAQFASVAGLRVGQLKLAYVKVVQRHSLGCFDEIVELFEKFSVT